MELDGEEPTRTRSRNMAVAFRLMHAIATAHPCIGVLDYCQGAI